MEQKKIYYVDVPFRAKTIESFQEKILRKNYKNPKSEMTDLAGIRVIAYTEGDVQRISEIIKSSFRVNEESSIDKATVLGDDRFGYRSVHFVCSIGQERAVLPEFFPYIDLFFEIQVRTALQHTWAEIEHDRSYKFSGDLPKKIKRRLHLVAGLLELADREFDELTVEIDKYKSDVHEKADSGNLDIELNSASVFEFLKVRLAKHSVEEFIEHSAISQELVEELNLYGIDNIEKLDLLLTSELLDLILEFEIKSNFTGLLRDAMMYENIQNYFRKSWQSTWTGIEVKSIAMLSIKYSEDIVNSIVFKYKLDVYDENDMEMDFGDDYLEND